MILATILGGITKILEQLRRALVNAETLRLLTRQAERMLAQRQSDAAETS